MLPELLTAIHNSPITGLCLLGCYFSIYLQVRCLLQCKNARIAVQILLSGNSLTKGSLKATEFVLNAVDALQLISIQNTDKHF